MSDDEPQKFATIAVHGGARVDPHSKARITPIYQTASYCFDDVDHAAALFNLEQFGNIYTRIMNPTQNVLEERMAALEGGTAALATASGHGAQLLVLHCLMSAGDEFIAAKQLYGGSLNQFAHSFKKFGWTARFADIDDPSSFAALVTEKTRAIFVESIANPGGVVTDLEALSKIANDAQIPLIVDNTLATPYLCQPKNFGADVIVHSMTKFLGGHGNSLGGILIDCGSFDWMGTDKFPTLSRPCESYHGLVLAEAFGSMALALAARVLSLRDLGPCISPFNAFLIATGLETLPLRMQKHTENAMEIARYLSAHDKVSWVSYAGLSDSPYHTLAKRICTHGAGAVFTFGLKGGYEAGVQLVNSVKLFSHLANVGDTRSLIIHPASTTHRQLSADDRAAAGAGDDVVRVSVGIEDVQDILYDLEVALSKL